MCRLGLCHIKGSTFSSFVLPSFPASTSFHPVSTVSPLKPEEFARQLSNHPNQSQVAFVLDGLRYGFRLEFHHSRKLKSATTNKPSAKQHPDVIDRYLANEVSLGRVAGPFSSPPLSNLHISSFGVIPQKGQPGKWRLIVDLSSPGGWSVNDGIDPDEFALQYITVDQIISMVSMCKQYGNVIGSLQSVCLLYTSPSPRDLSTSRMPSSA